MATTKPLIDDQDATEATQAGWTREQVAQSIINRHAVAGAGAGFIPIPGGDLLGISASALNLLKRLSDLYKVGFSRELALNVIMTLLSGAAPVALKATAVSMLKAIPGVGTFAGVATMPLLGGSSVYAVGHVMLRHYESGGDLLSFDAAKAKECFREIYAKKLREQQASAAEPTPG